MSVELIESFVSRLSDSNLDLRSRLVIVTELRDTVEFGSFTDEYEAFVQQILPVLLGLLNSTPVSMIQISLEHKLRNTLLDTISRLQTTEVLKPAAGEILTVVMHILHVDNEENGCVCMKILTNLHKAYKAHLIDQVQPFLDFVVEVFKNIPDLVNTLFNIPAEQNLMHYNAVTASAAGTNQHEAIANSPAGAFMGTPSATANLATDVNGASAGMQQVVPAGSGTGGANVHAHESAPLPDALHSFKVLTECPIIIVLLYATHKQLVSETLPVFVPFIVETLSIEAAPQAKEHAAAAAKGEYYNKVSPEIKNRAAYNDFIVAQIKIMSFLAYALRVYSNTLQNYYNLVPNFVVRLLKDCPAELSSARKELLVSMRHILSTYFRTFFISKVDVLLEENVLIGNGLTAHETLWPLAYSTMADLIHHVRNDLSVAQVWKAVNVYCRNLHDDCLATSFQIMSAKLLLNFMERVMKLPDLQEGRHIIIVILRAFVDRFAELNYLHLETVERSLKMAAKVDNDGEEGTSELPTMYKLLFYPVIEVHSESTFDEIKDTRYVYKNLMNFLKTIMSGLKRCNPPSSQMLTPQQFQEYARGFSYDEINLFRKLFREGLAGQIFFATPEHTVKQINEKFDAVPSLPIVASKDEKDMMESLATIFIHIDPPTFIEIIESELEFYYEAVIKNPALLHIAQLFLGSEMTSANFSAIMLSFLKSKLPELGDGDSQKSNILIRLFKLCFMAVNLFPSTNEAVILPHFRDFIVNFLDLTSNAKEPIVYFHLLRALFRSIAGGRFESLYKAVLPLLQVLLEFLNHRLDMARKPAERDIYVELCLTVPVRLSLLVPHLSSLMRPLVLALNGNPELVSQGLRTLELCVDNLTATYFDPIIEPVLNDVMEALWKHLRPLPYNHQQSHTTLRILGKLGGRNRAFLSGPRNLQYIRGSSADMTLLVPFEGISQKLPIKIKPAIHHAIQLLENPLMDVYHRKEAFKFLSSVSLQLLDPKIIENPESYAKLVRDCVALSTSSSFENSRPLPEDKKASSLQRNQTNELCEKILKALFLAASIDSLKDEAQALVINFCEHFTLIELGEFTIEKRRAMRPFQLEDKEGIPYAEPRVLLSAILFALSHFNPTIQELGLTAIRTIYETGKVICGPSYEVYRYPMIRSVFSKLSHGCFEEPYYLKAGACLGLKFLLRELDISLAWLKARQVELVRTIFFVIKDVTNDVPCVVRENASELLYYLVKRCNQDVTPEQISQRPFTLLSSLLAYELESANSAVREISKTALKLLAETVNQPLTDILKQVTMVFLTPIFGKPLRALPFPMQIGYIDAVSFSLELPNTFLRFNDKLIRLLKEALALVEADDESLTSAHRIMEYTTSQQLIELRVVCIKLLSLALTTSDHLAVHQPQTRAGIITAFFKILSMSSPRPLNAAHDALRSVLAQSSKLPKELLQYGLRPILIKLSDASKLTVAGLDSLARLLELLTYYFKVELGTKLLDHLRAWTEPGKLLPLANRNLNGQEPIEITVAILNVFHLLPPAAEMFLENIVTILVSVEATLRRVQLSPFRLPVLKFFEKHVQESYNYFLQRLSDVQFGHLFVDFLNMPLAVNLRNHCRQNFANIYQEVNNYDRPEDKCVAICNLISIFDTLVEDESHSEWLIEQNPVLHDLINYINELVNTAATLPSVSPLHVLTQAGIDRLQSLTVRYVDYSTSVNESGIGDTNLLLMLISSLANSNLAVGSMIVQHLYQHVILSTDVTRRLSYLGAALDTVVKAGVPLKARVFLMETLIKPVLLVEIERNGGLSQLFTKIGTDGWLDSFHKKIWLSNVDHPDYSTIDKYQFLLLEVSVLLVKHSPNLIADARKDLIKFGWSLIKNEDVVSKMSAYVLISHFIVAYDTLPKIITRIYAALLKAHQPEARTLVNQALDVLSKVLVQRTNSTLWEKYPRRILCDEGHNVLQVSNIYLFLTRNADLFFTYRDRFIPFILASMVKLSVMPNVHLDLDLAELVIRWEQRAHQERNKIKVDEDVDMDESTTDDKPTSAEHTLPMAHREIFTTCLVRYVCTQTQKATDTPIGQRALRLLNELLSDDVWPDVEVQLDNFDRSLVQSDLSSPESITAGINAFEVVLVTLKHKSKQWIQDNIEALGNLLERSLKCTAFTIHQALAPILHLIFKQIDPDNEMSQQFSRQIQAVLQDHLASNPSPLGWVCLTRELIAYQSSMADRLMHGAIKALSRAAKELIDLQSNTGSAGKPPVNVNTANARPTQRPPQGDATTAASNAVAPNAANAAPNVPVTGANATAPGAASNASVSEVKPDVATTPALLQEMIVLIGANISHLGDQRRVFLSIIAQVIERVRARDLFICIVGMIRSWVLSRTEIFPTIKEKAALIHKLLMYDSTDDEELTEKIYSIVIEVFTDDHTSKTELPARLEQPFLIGTLLGANANDAAIRKKLISILSKSLDKNALKRLFYIVMEQNWEFIGDQLWLNVALQLLYDSVDQSASIAMEKGMILNAPFDIITACLPEQHNSADMDVDHLVEQDKDEILALLHRRNAFIRQVSETPLSNVISTIGEMQYRSKDLVHCMWLEIFPALYKQIPQRDKNDLLQGIVSLLAKDYHMRQADARPNVVSTMVEALAQVDHLPPQLIKYLANNFGAWYPAIQIMENIQEAPVSDNQRVVDCNLDALAEVYAGLQENDMFYGLWRNRSKFIVTSSALSFEQCGLWNRAMQMHETAQIKARSGVLPYGESEYSLWEDHWILCAEKLQHWDILTELAKQEGFNDLLLECGWRVADWITDKEPLEQSIKSLMDVPTPRRQVFETFLALQGFAQTTESLQNLSKSCDEGIQLVLRKWRGLPQRVTAAHIPLLHTFQQYVEFMEASQVYTSLASTTSSNLEHKSQELKGVLQAWHERLPNQWDDINIWSDLVTWRQHVFTMINKVYLPLIPASQQGNNGASGGGSGSSSSHSAAYRGYHEIAWIINRFAHVVRKHGMTDVCIMLLSRIYTLPNIEIQEAFLKLREQAKCHYQNPKDVSTGLEVISNTNFAFFSSQQKSEFFTLRGMSLAKLGAEDHANEQFATAVQLDVYLPKAWAEWGRLSDKRFQKNPEDISHGATALSCYLQAAGLYKSAKSRKLLGRILWLLSFDNQTNAIFNAFSSYRGEMPVWYWITYIPQLLTSLGQREARYTSQILIKIAKTFPQALHFHLRTAREEYAVLQRQLAQQQQRQQQQQQQQQQTQQQQQPTGQAVNTPGAQGASGSPTVGNIDSPATSLAGSPKPQAQVNSPHVGETQQQQQQQQQQTPSQQEEKSKPWEYVDEIMGILKTAYPLLALSLETLVDQIYHRFKSPADEDAYRLIVALLNDGVQYMGRMPCPREDARLPPTTESSISRFAEDVLPRHIRASFEADFVTEKPNLETYIQKLRRWRDRFEAKLDARPNRINLEALSPPLSEFHYQKFEDVEIPGQNQELKDSNLHFVKIGRFLSNVEVVRGFGLCHRRLTIRGNDGSLHPFAVQYPAARHCRREERVSQIFKILNSVLSRRIEARSRNLQFTLPNTVPLNNHIRLVQDDANYISFYRIYERFCRIRGQSRDMPVDYCVQKTRAAFDPRLPKPEVPAIRMEILNGIQSSLAPPTIMRDYFAEQYNTFEEFWLFKKQFSYQYACVCFMTVTMSINNRYPHKFFVNMSNGNIWATEMLPLLASNKSTPSFYNGEPVAFRLTPNIQTLLGPTALEGIFGMSMMIIAKGLTEPESNLGQYLPVFVRDELISWYTQQQRRQDGQLKEIVKSNVEGIVKRATSLAHIGTGNIPANQTVIDLISLSVNPRHLAMMDFSWMPYF